MPTNLKTWLETTGYTVAEDRFNIPPQLPYIVFRSTDETYGSDTSNLLTKRQVDIELYANVVNPVAEKVIEDLLDAKPVSYSKDREWIPTEKFFQTVYSIELTERK